MLGAGHSAKCAFCTMAVGRREKYQVFRLAEFDRGGIYVGRVTCRDAGKRVAGFERDKGAHEDPN